MHSHRTWLPGLLSDDQIKHLARDHGMIEPFEDKPVREVTKQIGSNTTNPTMMGKRVVSYGLTSYGYDMRIADEFKVFESTWDDRVIDGVTHTDMVEVDPKAIDERCWRDEKVEDYCVIPPNSFALCRSLERFKIPNDVLCVVLGKSTYARCGIIVNVTPLEPAWEGYVTIEISNTTPLPARIYANEGIAQVLFFKGSAACLKSYADKNGGAAGKYQDQAAEIVLPKV